MDRSDGRKDIEDQAFDVLPRQQHTHTVVFMGRLQGTTEDERVTRILVVDDNASVRRYLRCILELQHGWRVCDEARNGEEAVERFRAVHPDVVVLDFQMPLMNGLDAARVIARLSPKTPILMVTLYLTKQLSEEARRVGVRGTCTKMELNRVVDAVGALLREETYFQKAS